MFSELGRTFNGLHYRLRGSIPHKWSAQQTYRGCAYIRVYIEMHPSAQPAKRWPIVSALCSTIGVPDNGKSSLSCLIERYDSPQSSIDPAPQISFLC